MTLEQTNRAAIYLRDGLKMVDINQSVALQPGDRILSAGFDEDHRLAVSVERDGAIVVLKSGETHDY